MPKLFLIPNNISEGRDLLPDYIKEETKNVHVFFVEEAKSARQLLKTLSVSLHGAIFLSLNEHTPAHEIQSYVTLLKQYDCAIVSEAGCPCVADPGADLVWLAHQNNIEVVPLVGPSSILLALMASGLNGQNFAFNGYLPKDGQERAQKIRGLEARSQKEGQTQIFMEAPYHNQSLLKDILSCCQEKTLLCVALDISGPAQAIKTMAIQEWKKNPPKIGKNPALFLLNSL